MISAKTYYQVSGAIFFIVALMHLLRFLTEMPIVFGTWTVPVWFSLVGFVIAGTLTYSAFTLFQKKSAKK